MTMPHSQSLQDSQLRTVLDHARPIPVLWRSRWLSAVADRLIAKDVLTGEDVHAAIKIANEQIGVPA